MGEPSDFEVAQTVWKEALGLQTHFNDILFRLRSFFFLFLGAAATFGAKSDVLQRVLESPASVFVLTPALAVYILDRFYYHLLLVGAVEAARRVEEKYPDLELSETIRKANVSSAVFGGARGRQKVTFFYAMPVTVAAGFLTAGPFGPGFGVLVGLLVALAFVEVERRAGRSEEQRFPTERADDYQDIRDADPQP